MSRLVRNAGVSCFELNHMPTALVVPAVNSFEFSTFGGRTAAEFANVSCAALISYETNIFSTHRLRRGLPGPILFAPHAFAPQCQLRQKAAPATEVLPFSAFHRYTRNFHFFSPALKFNSFQ